MLPTDTSTALGAWAAQPIACGEAISKITLLSRARCSPTAFQRSLHGSIAGEAAFEDWMGDRGVRIVHPETLAFEQQLSLFQ